MCKFLRGMTGTESMRMHVFHFTHQYFLCYLHHFSNYFLKRYQPPRILSIACWRRAAYWWVWHRGSFPWVQNFGCLKFWEERDTGEWGEVKVGCMNSSLDLAVNSRFRRTERQSPIFWERNFQSSWEFCRVSLPWAQGWKSIITVSSARAETKGSPGRILNGFPLPGAKTWARNWQEVGEERGQWVVAGETGTSEKAMAALRNLGTPRALGTQF